MGCHNSDMPAQQKKEPKLLQSWREAQATAVLERTMRRSLLDNVVVVVVVGKLTNP